MATHLRVPVEEYLSTSYSPDPDYVDGELRQRNAGEYPHSKVQRYSGDGLRPAEAFEIPKLGAKLAAGEIFL
jgi:hypothetical protein